MATLNIVTAVSRPANLMAVLRSMEGVKETPDLRVRWILVYDDPPRRPRELDTLRADHIEIIKLPWLKGPCKFGIHQKNFGIDNCEPGFYHLLDDDNKVHPDFFKGISQAIHENPGKQAFAFHQRRWDRHGDLQAIPRRMKPGKIDNTMFVVHTGFIESKRYDIAAAGREDGWFFSELYKKDPTTWCFIDRFLAYYNYFRKHPAEAKA